MIQRPRGTKDIYGKDELIYKIIFDSFEQLATTYNLKKIITPTLMENKQISFQKKFIVLLIKV